jgi:hypothetical protein
MASCATAFTTAVVASGSATVTRAFVPYRRRRQVTACVCFRSRVRRRVAGRQAARARKVLLAQRPILRRRVEGESVSGSGNVHVLERLKSDRAMGRWEAGYDAIMELALLCFFRRPCVEFTRTDIVGHTHAPPALRALLPIVIPARLDSRHRRSPMSCAIITHISPFLQKPSTQLRTRHTLSA